MTREKTQEPSQPDIFLNVNEIDRAAVFRRLNRLNMLHHLHLNSVTLSDRVDPGMDHKGSIPAHQYPENGGNGGLIKSLETSINIAENFYSFLVENRMALDEVKSNINALVFGRISDVVGMWEEYVTKEDPLKDILIQMVPFLLSAFSEKSYISSAEIGHKGIMRTYSLYIYSAVYSYLKDTKGVRGPGEAEEISTTMEELFHALDSAVGNSQGLYLYAVLFLILYNLRAQEILNILNHQSARMKTEV